MRIKQPLLNLLLATSFALGFTATPAFAAPSAHQHDHAGAPATLSLDAGRKWATDEALRKAMANIGEAFEASLQDIHQGKFPAAKYNALAKKIRSEVGSMVSQCKLPPKADAQLHLIIADLLAGAEAMEGKSKHTKRIDGAVQVLGALENYGIYFDDQGWVAIKH